MAPLTSDDTAASDAALVRRVEAGDEAALASLYDRYANLVYSVAFRVLRDKPAAEEILQDIFYQLWRTADRFDPARGSLPGWLLVAARNRAISRLRRSPAFGPNAPADDPARLEVALPFNLESAVAQRQAMSKVQQSMQQLPPEQRQALEMAYFEGMTHSEIAARTGDPLGTIKSRLRAAVETLRRVLNP
ncbi:MAG: sigma-70 family RNA polymerase sigma factor [Candidatus Acidiferrales bacterium]